MSTKPTITMIPWITFNAFGDVDGTDLGGRPGCSDVA